MSGKPLALSILVSGLDRLFGSDLARLLELSRAADAAGIDQLVLPDHLAIGTRTDRYPYGRFPLPVEEPWLEPLTALAAIAGATGRIRLGTGILIAPLRPALLLAKTAATLDVLSQGRLDLGIGTGWQREEFDGAGVPFAGRTARMDDTVRACRALWRFTPASFSSETVSFRELRCLPRPVQPGGPPIWIGGALTEGNLARLVEYGTGWLPIAESDEAWAAGRDRARSAFEGAGRNPDDLGLRAPLAAKLAADGRIDLDATLAELPRLRALGATAVSIPLARFIARPEEAPAFFERLSRAER